MSEHTKEPWIFEAPDADFSGIIIGKHGGEVVDGEFTEANGRRIVACVNACEGMGDPEKEIALLRAELAELRKDAERYRFARSRAYVAVNPYYKSCLWTLRGVLEVDYNAAETHGFDAAIDKAMERSGE